MIRTLSAALVLSGLMAGAAPPERPLYARTVQACPAPLLDAVRGREYKFLVDPAGLPGEPEAAFRALWDRIQAAAKAEGFTVLAGSRKGRKPPRVEAAVKTYLDTPAQDLWRLGRILRVSTKAKSGERSVTVKVIDPDPARTLAVPLKVAGGRTEAEGNVGMGPDGRLAEYVEKGTTWPAGPGVATLGDFGRDMPELLGLGLPAGTPLAATTVHAVQFKPGVLELPGLGPVPFAMEGWSRTEGGAVFVYEVSYRFDPVDYYRDVPALEAGERFMAKVLAGRLKGLMLPGAGRWGGSKVRLLLGRPLSR